MAQLKPDSIDAICTDPPYGIRFMGQAWDGEDIESRATAAHDAKVEAEKRGEPGRAGRKTSAFANRSAESGAYDFSPAGMIAFHDWTRAWATEAIRVLKPGGYLVSFASARTYHRMVCGIEEAGFEIRDQLMWLYGSGFPKSLDVSKQIDKAAGAERTEGAREWSGGARSGGIVRDDEPEHASTRTIYDEPATDDGRAWDGWGTALKPAHEPIVLARKPFPGTVTGNVLEHGVGALNIAGSRVGAAGGTRQTVPKAKPDDDAVTSFGRSIGSAPGGNEDAGGRWPSNVVLSHLPECEGSGPNHTDVLCAHGCPVAELNESSGESVSSGTSAGTPDSSGIYGDGMPRGDGRATGKGDIGGAARFFYIAKTKRRERIGGTVRNLHPTVKPIDLMRHLVRLVTPAGGTVLDPFLGSGSTGCAAMLEGMRFVGVEREQPSFDTALARVSDYAFARGRERPVVERLTS